MNLTSYMLQKKNSQNTLSHFGILGMKWGRRKQKIKKQSPSQDSQEKKLLRKRSLSSLSNKELEQINRRIELENRYKDNISIARKAQRRLALATGLASGVYGAYELGRRYHSTFSTFAKRK